MALCTQNTGFGYSRDRRPDCVQVVIALVVTPEGFPLGYDVYPGNTRDELLMRLGEARKSAGRAWSLVDIHLPDKNEPVTSETFTYALFER